MSVEAFQADVRAWPDTARHPQTGKRFDEMLYQLMLEILRYLRGEDFQTWIVSGGVIHFIRAFAADAYNIAPEQVIESSTPTAYDETVRQVVKQPGIAFVDDKAGKPVAIDLHIGQRPIFVGGSFDGEREFAYDREGPIGKPNRGLDEGPEKGWLIVDMAADWQRVWPTQ